ncbi:MAG: LysM domain-containing protein [Chloroflexota bacterium]
MKTQIKKRSNHENRRGLSLSKPGCLRQAQPSTTCLIAKHGWWLALLFGGMSMILLLPLSLHAQQAADPTATPDADGVIYAEVREGDSLWFIVGRSGISIETLLALNGITENTLIRPGDRLIIGIVTAPATETPEAAPLATLPPPTPTNTPPPPPQTAVCLLAYVDQNQNGVRDPDEKLRPAVAFTIYNENEVVANYVTTGVSEPHCLNLAPGAYQITRSLARNESLTTDGDVAVALRQGDVLALSFGGFIGPTATPSLTPEPGTPEPVPSAGEPLPIGAEPAVETVPDTGMEERWDGGENGRFPVWLTFIFILLPVLMGAGVIFFVVRMRQT